MNPSNDRAADGWINVTCIYHPDLRWTIKDPRVARISRNPGVMFDGDINRPDAMSWPDGQPDPELRKKLEESGEWVIECPCKWESLVPLYRDEWPVRAEKHPHFAYLG